MDKNKLKIYDDICGAAFVNIFTLTKDEEVIAIKGLNPKNKEHLFVLGVAKGLAGAFEKKVALDVSRFRLWKLNRKIDKDCRLIRLDEKSVTKYVQPDELLSFMREKAIEAYGKDFSFADIYKEYYARKKVK